MVWKSFLNNPETLYRVYFVPTFAMATKHLTGKASIWIELAFVCDLLYRAENGYSPETNKKKKIHSLERQSLNSIAYTFV